MMSRLQSCCLAIAMGLAAPHSASADERANLQAACWPPSALAARTGESTPARSAGATAIRAPSPNAAKVPSSGFVGTTGVVRRVALPPGKKQIALTFDLCETSGETAGYDGAIIDYLRAQQVKATLFAGGHWMTTHRTRAAQLMSDTLFEIGTHGWSHLNTRMISGAELEREVLSPSVTYTAIRSELRGAQCAVQHGAAFSSIPEAPKLFRFPFGSCNPAALRAVAESGLTAIQWDVATGDPSPHQSARAIADAMIRGARPGSIVIMHANGRGYHTAEALPLAIPALRAKGFEFVTISELMAAGAPIIAETCYDAHPGDTDKYDFMFSRKSAPGSQELSSSHAGVAPAVRQ